MDEVTAFINSQPARITNGIARLGGDNEWYCIPCYPDLPDDCSEWPTYGMLKMDLASITISGLNPGDYILPIQDARTLLGMKNRHTVTQVVFSASINALYGTVVFEIGRCGVYDGVYGVEDLPWYPSHAPNHYDESICLGLGCICSSGPAWFVGFDHAKVNTRNLSVLEKCTEENYRKTEHCLGVVWRPGNANTNLFDLLAPSNIPNDILTNLYFIADGIDVKYPAVFSYGPDPKDMEPTIYHIELRHRQRDGIVFDRLWLTVNGRATYSSYTNWVAVNSTNMAWTLTLPQPFDSIDVSGKLVSPDPNAWPKLKECDSYLHHDAAYDMRSKKMTGGWGHQACYTANGILITEGVAAGSADLAEPYSSPIRHQELDVKPFIRALQLDGNPCLAVTEKWVGVVFISDLKRPMIYQGDYLDQYLKCRPATPTGTQPRPQ